MKFLEQKIAPAKPLLLQYQAILLQWQQKVNLISKNTINDLWIRHILDSAQLYFLIPNDAISLMDVGSGAGFPGLVIAILNKALNGNLKDIVLVESDLKKSLFLQEVIRNLNLNVRVLNQRMEDVKFNANVITARAVSSTENLLKWVDQNVSRETLLLFLKGKNVEDELKEISSDYKIKKEKSVVDPEGCVLIIRKEKRV